jgi:hypothetical protein
LAKSLYRSFSISPAAEKAGLLDSGNTKRKINEIEWTETENGGRVI